MIVYCTRFVITVVVLDGRQSLFRKYIVHAAIDCAHLSTAKRRDEKLGVNLCIGVITMEGSFVNFNGGERRCAISMALKIKNVRDPTKISPR